MTRLATEAWAQVGQAGTEADGHPERCGTAVPGAAWTRRTGKLRVHEAAGSRRLCGHRELTPTHLGVAAGKAPRGSQEEEGAVGSRQKAAHLSTSKRFPESAELKRAGGSGARPEPVAL